MEVSTHSFDELDLTRLSAFILESKQASGTWRAETTLDHVEATMNRTFGGTKDTFLLVEDSGVILGCAILHLSDDGAEVNPWFMGGLPVIGPGLDEIEVASLLLGKAVGQSKSEGINRLEITFPKEKHSDPIKSLLKDKGFSLVEEIVHMRGSLSDLARDVPPLRKSVVSQLLTEADRDDLYRCWTETFLQGNDRSILSKTDAERKTFFEESFNFEEDLIEEASVGLSQDSQLIAFSLVRPTHGEKNGHLWEMGVHPESRGRGLAKYLLAHAVQQLIGLGFETMSLNVDAANTPAYRLYKAIGLQDDWCLVSYNWRLGR